MVIVCVPLGLPPRMISAFWPSEMVGALVVVRVEDVPDKDSVT